MELVTDSEFLIKPILFLVSVMRKKLFINNKKITVKMKT